MNIPGLTTTRLTLMLAALCALTGSLAGVATALLMVAVTGARLLVRSHTDAVRMPATPAGTGLAPIPVLTPSLTPGRQAA